MPLAEEVPQAASAAKTPRDTHCAAAPRVRTASSSQCGRHRLAEKAFSYQPGLQRPLLAVRKV